MVISNKSDRGKAENAETRRVKVRVLCIFVL